jgi:DNA polymerase (family 10)
MKNQLVANILYQIADLLDLKGEIFFKTRAYRMAAQNIEVLEEDIEDIIKKDKLKDIPGVGEALAKKIKELVETDKLEYFENLKKEFPEGILDLLNVPGLGPKKVAAIYKNLGIASLKDLQKAASEGKLRDLFGFGEITEQNIIRGIQLLEKTTGRALLNVAYEDGTRYLEYLKKCDYVDNVSLAGSLRRMKETIGDLDILASSSNPEIVMDYFIKYSSVQHVLSKGSTKSSVILKDNIQVDLRVVEAKSFGAALQYFTGSKEHNVTLRGYAINKGYKLNEYGLFKKYTEKFIVGKTEEEIYNKIGFPFIEPELRENRGEFEAAKNKNLPKLIGYDQILGDLHIHSVYSDGNDSIETLAAFAKNLGYEYIGIADHSQSLKIANGLSEERIIKKIAEINKLNKKYQNFKILCGTECDIKSDGSLDYNNKILKMFDYVYIGIHSGFKMDKNKMTQRIIDGMENENADFLAHPTGRLIGKRDSYQVDIESVIDAAKESDTRLEINSFPDRLDLDDFHAKVAKQKRVNFVIGTDSHSTSHIPFIKFGIATARRGWLEKKDVLNTNSLENIEKILGA